MEVVGQGEGQASKMKPRQVTWAARRSKNVPSGSLGTVRKVGMVEGTLKTSVPTLQLGLAPALRGEQVKYAAGCAWCLWTPAKSWDYL